MVYISDIRPCIILLRTSLGGRIERIAKEIEVPSYQGGQCVVNQGTDNGELEGSELSARVGSRDWGNLGFSEDRSIVRFGIFMEGRTGCEG